MFPTTSFTHELIMFANDPSTGTHFHYISQMYRIFLQKFQFVLCKHISAIGIPVLPFFISGRNVRTGTEKKFIIYIFLKMRRSMW